MLAHAVFCFCLLPLSAKSAEPFEFNDRPTRATKAFPSQSSFKEIQSRRLNEGEGKPERRLFEAEENGHRFAYEFAGESVAGQILDVDKEASVQRIACRTFLDERQLANYIMWLQWDAAALPGIGALARNPLKPGDVLTGSSGWRCGKTKEVGFLREVVSVRSHATSDDPSTEIITRDVSPLQVFKDLYIDFTWTKPVHEQDGARHLTALTGRNMDANSTMRTALAASSEPWAWESEIGDYSFNYDNASNSAKEYIEMGVLLCENCYAYLKPVMKFKLVTDGFYPKEVSLRFDLDAVVNVDIVVHPDTQDNVKAESDKWDSLVNERGDDFLRDLLAKQIAGLSGDARHVVVPLFHELADALNLEAFPITEMFSKIGGDVITLLQKARLTASMSLRRDETFLELGWKQETGIYSNYSFNLRPALEVSGFDHDKSIFFGLKLCAGVSFSVGNTKDPLTELLLCPEMLLNKNADANAMVVPQALLKTSLVHDKTLCITFVSFETDLDLDGFLDGQLNTWEDDPYAQACFQGKCVTTGHSRFQGDVVSWNEEKCMDVTQSHLFGEDAGAIAFVVKELDLMGYSDQYTQQQLWKLPDTCTEQCEKTFSMMTIPSSVKHKGKGEKNDLIVKIEFKELGGRRAQGNVPLGDSCGPTQSAVATTLGFSGRWSGFTYPSFFREGQGDQVIPPTEAPVMRLRDAELTCVEVQAFLSCAYSLSHGFHLISAMILVCLFSGGNNV